MSEPEYLLPKEVAARYRISAGTLANYRCHGIGPKFIRYPSGRIVYRVADVEAWIRNNDKEN